MNNSGLSSLHGRRPPAHLSVSLRHGDTIMHESLAAPAAHKRRVTSTPSRTREPSNDSKHSNDSTGHNPKKWFDQSNEHPPFGKERAYEDNESPFFQQHSSNGSSNDLSHAGAHIPTLPSQRSVPVQAGTHRSGSDDYRSVIDDLTIENRKLKEKLRKYEASYNAQLQKDKLFELKVHGLPARKKRELEETLRVFASSIDGSPGHSSKRSRKSIAPQCKTMNSISATGSKNPSTSSTSNSRPIHSDSAYASISASGRASNPWMNHVKLDSKSQAQVQAAKEEKVELFLHDIPQGLLARRPADMSERQKKKEVVRRLEQLFTGKSKIGADHSQSLQQQEVSKSAAMADHNAKNEPLTVEGVREAHILPQDTDVDNGRYVDRASDSSDDSMKEQGRAPGGTRLGSASIEQRPTRPMDLDPDRDQVPSDNVQYIRHLGLSTPQLITETSSDAEADADGWIYVNLLFSMAQLHILSVSTDFVKFAVAEVSEKFQLSRDGRKIRWRGGTEGTRLSSASSESESNNTQSRSPFNSQQLDEHSRKRRRVSPGLNQGHQKQSAPGRPRPSKKITNSTDMSNAFQYRPIFQHHVSSETDYASTDGSSSRRSGSSRVKTSAANAGTLTSGSGYPERRRREDGPIVFYSRAQFCVDYSGDSGGILAPQHLTNHSTQPLGANHPARPTCFLGRTPSGSFLASRPFKDYSIGPSFLQTRPKTPDLICGSDSEDLEFSPSWGSARSAQPSPLLQEFKACGLGGTQPADHFVIRVKTKRTILSERLVNEIAASAGAPTHSRQFLRKLRRSSLHSILAHRRTKDCKDILSKMPSLRVRSPPATTQDLVAELPVTIELIATSCPEPLRPSSLPPPAFLSTHGSSEDDTESMTSVSSSGVSCLRQSKPHFSPSTGSGSENDLAYDDYPDMTMQDVEDDDEDDESDGDSSIDMLAHAREVDPDTIAAREQEFESQAQRRLLEELPAGSSAATVASVASGYYSEEVTVGSSDNSSE